MIGKTARALEARAEGDAELVARVHARMRRELGELVYLRYLAAMASKEGPVRRRWRSASIDELIAQLDRSDTP